MVVRTIFRPSHETSSDGVLRDTTPYAQRLAQIGAYPQRAPDGTWRVPQETLIPVLDAYVTRSKNLLHDSAGFEPTLQFFLTNEREFAQAIAPIQNRGDAFVGVGQMLPFTYAGWQGAEHAYVLDCNGLIPFGFTPLYGLMQAMATNRREFASILLGRPLLADARHPRPEQTGTELLAEMRHIPRDPAFTEAIVGTLAQLIADRGPLQDNTVIHRAVRGWWDLFGKTHAVWPNPDAHNALEVSLNTDDTGRGTALSSETALQQERALMIDNRITGVASNIMNGGMAFLQRDLIRRRIPLGALHLSNLEDTIVGGENASFSPTPPTPEQVGGWYRMLSLLPNAADALVITAPHTMDTTAEVMSKYLARAVALQAPNREAGVAARAFFDFRTKILILLKQYSLTRLVAAIMPLSEESRSLRNILHRRFAFEIDEGITYPRHWGETLLRRDYAFQELPPEQQELFVNNLEHIGFLERSPKMPAPTPEPDASDTHDEIDWFETANDIDCLSAPYVPPFFSSWAMGSLPMI